VFELNKFINMWKKRDDVWCVAGDNRNFANFYFCNGSIFGLKIGYSGVGILTEVVSRGISRKGVDLQEK
jgi:hypothetical protein